MDVMINAMHKYYQVKSFSLPKTGTVKIAGRGATAEVRHPRARAYHACGYY